MKITQVNDPWPYLIVDDIYPPKLFQRMVDEMSKAMTGVNSINKTGIRNLSEKDLDNLPAVQEAIEVCDIKSFLPYFSNKRSTNPTSTTYQLAATTNFFQNVHDESYQKVLSCIVYITPEKSTGTLIYKTYGQQVGEVEWKPNRAFIFCGINNVTWHSYKADGENRITFNQFLIDSRLKPYKVIEEY